MNFYYFLFVISKKKKKKKSKIAGPQLSFVEILRKTLKIYLAISYVGIQLFLEHPFQTFPPLPHFSRTHFTSKRFYNNLKYVTEI